MTFLSFDSPVAHPCRLYYSLASRHCSGPFITIYHLRNQSTAQRTHSINTIIFIIIIISTIYLPLLSLLSNLLFGIVITIFMKKGIRSNSSLGIHIAQSQSQNLHSSLVTSLHRGRNEQITHSTWVHASPLDGHVVHATP